MSRFYPARRFPASAEPCEKHELGHCHLCAGVRVSYGLIQSVAFAKSELADIAYLESKGHDCSADRLLLEDALRAMGEL